MKRFIPVLLALPLFAASANPILSDSDTQKVIDFLQNQSDVCGLAYKATAGMLNRLKLPQSYLASPQYFFEYVGKLPGNNLNVIDVYDEETQMVIPEKDSPGAELQRERVSVFYGTNIKDAALWQIALAAHGQMRNKKTLFALANDQNDALEWGYDGNEDIYLIGANRATSEYNTYLYNGTEIRGQAKAYFYRNVGRSTIAIDPFMGTKYMKYIRTKNLPEGYKAGNITWADMRPFTKDNAWALFIGPMQAAMIEQNVTGAAYIPFNSEAVQNAIYSLTAFRALKNETGSLFETCSDITTPDGTKVDPLLVTIEGNAMAIVGLNMANDVFNAILNNDNSLGSDDKTLLSDAIKATQELVYGDGSTFYGGLMKFFKEHSFGNGSFYKEGRVVEGVWKPNTTAPNCASTNIYALSALGQIAFDSFQGFGASKKLWDNIKSWSGFYGPKNQLWGIGFSSEDGNRLGAKMRNQVISTENTAAAINLLRTLIWQYTKAQTSFLYTHEQQERAKTFIAPLQKDLDSLLANFTKLRTDKYPKVQPFAAGVPKNYKWLIPIGNDLLGFVEASKRYKTPFGEQKNPLPHTGSTAWSIIVNYNFNPLPPAMNY